MLYIVTFQMPAVGGPVRNSSVPNRPRVLVGRRIVQQEDFETRQPLHSTRFAQRGALRSGLVHNVVQSLVVI